MERHDRLQEPDAVIPLVRICEGGDPQGSSLPRPGLRIWFGLRSVFQIKHRIRFSSDQSAMIFDRQAGTERGQLV